MLSVLLRLPAPRFVAPPPPQAPCGHRPPALFSPQSTMSDCSTPSQDSPSPAPDTGRGGAICRGPFPMFVMEIAESDDTDRLLREMDMLKDDALEAADTAIRATDPALADLCDALRWPAADGDIQAITAVTGVWTPRGLLLTATVTVAAGPSDTKVIEHVPLSLVQGGPLLEYVSKDPEALTAALSRDGVQAMFRSLRRAFAAKSSRACTRPENSLRPSTLPLLQTSKAKRSPTRFTSPSASSLPPT